MNNEERENKYSFEHKYISERTDEFISEIKRCIDFERIGLTTDSQINCFVLNIIDNKLAEELILLSYNVKEPRFKVRYGEKSPKDDSRPIVTEETKQDLDQLAILLKESLGNEIEFNIGRAEKFSGYEKPIHNIVFPRESILYMGYAIVEYMTRRIREHISEGCVYSEIICERENGSFRIYSYGTDPRGKSLFGPILETV